MNLMVLLLLGDCRRLRFDPMINFFSLNHSLDFTIRFAHYSIRSLSLVLLVVYLSYQMLLLTTGMDLSSPVRKYSIVKS